MDDANDLDGDYKVIEQCLQQTQVSPGKRIWGEREGRGGVVGATGNFFGK